MSIKKNLPGLKLFHNKDGSQKKYKIFLILHKL